MTIREFEQAGVKILGVQNAVDADTDASSRDRVFSIEGCRAHRAEQTVSHFSLELEAFFAPRSKDAVRTHRLGAGALHAPTAYSPVSADGRTSALIAHGAHFSVRADLAPSALPARGSLAIMVTHLTAAAQPAHRALLAMRA